MYDCLLLSATKLGINFYKTNLLELRKGIVDIQETGIAVIQEIGISRHFSWTTHHHTLPYFMSYPFFQNF